MKKNISTTIVLVAGLFLFAGSAHATTNSCRIVIDAPSQTTPVMFPLHVSGTILPTSETCVDEWVHSEDQAGRIAVYDSKGVALTEEISVPVSFTPPAVYPIKFSVNLKLKDLAPQTSNGTIVILDREDSDAEGTVSHSFTSQITFGEKHHATHTFKKTLKPGMRASDDVKELQKILIARGYLKGTATGNYLSGTQKAVMEYQKDHNLPQTGTCGSYTRALLSDGE